MSRREALVELLARLDDLADGAFGRNGVGRGDEDAVPLLAHDRHCQVFSSLKCTCWRRSVTELERCLAVLSDLMPRQYSHLNGRFRLTTKARRRHVRVRGGRWQGLDSNERVVIPDFSPAKPPDRTYDEVLVERWPVWVSGAVVDEAVAWLEGNYRGEPELPAEAFAA